MDGTERGMLQFVFYRAESGNNIKLIPEELDSKSNWAVIARIQ